ncbi:ester cyclase [Pectobacterium fontis]|uniref:ester cyclase n=1 Tax=Pectobacterium fontis TaxID=2558042 RepID=UPI000907BC8B|nr:ester cyclase [Pectobacterium fontis]
MNDHVSLATAFYQAFNANDSTAFDRLLATDWINHPADPGQPNTPAGFKHAVAYTHAAFEGFHINIEAVVAENDLVVCRIAMNGRHIRDFDHWKASGKQVRFTGMDMHRIEGGKIRETWHFENFDGLRTVEIA